MTKDWLLIFILSGFAGNHPPHFEWITEKQCMAIVRLSKPNRRRIGVACYGPNGEAFAFDDVK